MLLIDELIELRKPTLESDAPYKARFADYLTKCIQDDYTTVCSMFKDKVKQFPRDSSCKIVRNYSVPDTLIHEMKLFYNDFNYMKKLNHTISHTLYPGISICTLEHNEPVKVWSSKPSQSVDVVYNAYFNNFEG